MEWFEWMWMCLMSVGKNKMQTPHRLVWLSVFVIWPLQVNKSDLIITQQ